MFKKALVVISLLTFASVPAHAIVNGHEIGAGELRAHEPVLRLYFNGVPCTGTHIGHGLILTAGHCSKPTSETYGENPNLSIKDIEGRTLGSVFGYKYEALTPSGITPTPDLVVLRLNSEALRQSVAALDAVTLSQGTPLTAATTDLRIAGQGCGTDIDDHDHDVLRTGTLQGQITDRSSVYSFSWTLGKTGAYPCPGDSGGPLYSIDAQGRMIQYGVGSLIRPVHPNGHLLSVTSEYTRVDTDAVRRWLASIPR